jgi:Zn ribbon nucleic-acid-binding protein
MISLGSCPRCNGAVLEYLPSGTESALCINCGWRQPDIPPQVQAQVDAHMGRPYLEQPYNRNRIGTGKPPLSGWDRVKLRRERERRGMAP